MNVSVTLDDAAIDQIVERAATRAAEIVSERMAAGAGDRWLRGAADIANYLGCPVSRVNAWRQTGLPIQKDGSVLTARTSALDAWVEAGGGTRL